MNRKELIREYKNTPKPAGVFRVRNTAQNKSFIGTSTNLPAMLNRQRFQLETGAHPDRELQQDWNELGPDAFAFEILDQLEPSKEPDTDPTEDLRVLKALWVEKLTAAGEKLYPRCLRRDE
ncbi:MAG TPA: GIY-YIG nuclease family protein [Limnochorda sp.]